MTTTKAPVSLRPANPTVGDGLVFARLLDVAQEGAFRAMLGRRAGDIIAAAFTKPGHEYSFEHVTFAVHDGRLVGMSAGYTAETHRRFTDELLEAVSGWDRGRLVAFRRLARRVLRFIDTVPDGDFYVRALAVDEAHRGVGIGTSLLESLERAARAAGANRIALDVAAKNRDARRLYERIGMTVEAESPKWFWLPNTNLIRMVKAL